jgi:uncharacterized protein
MLFGPRAGAVQPPADLTVNEVVVKGSSGDISIWDVPTAPGSSGSDGAPRPVVLYLHGTDITVQDAMPTIRAWHELGLRVVAFDYRGFGESPGKPSAAGFVDDANAVMKWMVDDRKINGSQIIVHGHSMGTAVAIQLGARRPELKGLILEGAFTNAEDILAKTWGRWYPWRQFVGRDHDAFNSIRKVGELMVPILVVHGERDASVPPSQGQRIGANVKCGEFVMIKGKGHTDVFPTVGKQVFGAFNNVLSKCAK